MNPKVLDGTVWMMDESRLKVMTHFIRSVSVPDSQAVAAAQSARMAARESDTRQARRVAVVPISGMISKSFDVMCWLFGGTACDEISMAMDILCDMPDVETILLKIDSPGGSTYGVEELSQKIYSLRAKKRILAIADPMACSAAYYIGTAAEKFYCIPSGDVGSVGVYRIHVDESKALEAEGVTVSVIQAGKYKAEGMPFRPLSDDAKAFLQADVDRIYAKFLADVGRNRGISAQTVAEKHGQGRPVAGPDAISAGMVDGLTTFDSLYSSVASPQRKGQSMASAQHEQAKRLKEKTRIKASLTNNLT